MSIVVIGYDGYQIVLIKANTSPLGIRVVPLYSAFFAGKKT